MANPFATGQPFTNKTAAQGGSTLADYEKRIAADPTYKATKSGDMVGWITQNYGKEWLKPDGTAPDEAIWTYTGGKNGQPKIGSVTGINYLPWNSKDVQYDQANGQDYSRPQYANGPGIPSGGYKGTAAEIQADRDANNFYRNGGKGMSPAMLQSMAYINSMGGLKGLPRDSYKLPDGGVYNRAHMVQDPATKQWVWQDANFNGPGGSWQDTHFSTPMKNGIYKGRMPGSAATGGGNGPRSGPSSWGPGAPQQPAQGGGQGGGIPGPVPIPGGASPYVSGLASNGRFQAGAPQQQRGAWMEQMSADPAMAQQAALVAALRG